MFSSSVLTDLAGHGRDLPLRTRRPGGTRQRLVSVLQHCLCPLKSIFHPSGNDVELLLRRLDFSLSRLQSVQAAASPALSAVCPPVARAFHSSAILAAADVQPPTKASGAAQKNALESRMVVVSLPSTSGDPAPVSASPSQLPPSVAPVVEACALSRATLRAKAPFLKVKPSEWTDSKVKEFTKSGSDFKARDLAHVHSLFTCFQSRRWTCHFRNTCAGVETRSGNAARDVGHGDHSEDGWQRV
jgi:hypothetical protein